MLFVSISPAHRFHAIYLFSFFFLARSFLALFLIVFRFRWDGVEPMLECDGCNEWYHFICVGEKEGVRFAIWLFVCPPHRDSVCSHGVDVVVLDCIGQLAVFLCRWQKCRFSGPEPGVGDTGEQYHSVANAFSMCFGLTSWFLNFAKKTAVLLTPPNKATQAVWPNKHCTHAKPHLVAHNSNEHFFFKKKTQKKKRKTWKIGEICCYSFVLYTEEKKELNFDCSSTDDDFSKKN